MTAVDVLRARVVFWSGRLLRFYTELVKKRSEVNGLLSCLRGGHDFCFTEGQRDGGLLLRSPGYRGLSVQEHVARRGVPRRPVGIGKTVQVADGAVKVEVHQNTTRVIEQRARRAAYGSTEHADRVGHVGPRLCRAAVEQSTDEGHVFAVNVRVYGPLPLGEQAPRLHVLRQVFSGRDVRHTEGARHSVGQVRACQMLDVFTLREADVPLPGGDVDVE
eukprot:6183138-Pleurochrysis_carterae.AAC.10